MNKSFVIASDLGTSGCKTVLVDEKARVVSSAQYEYPTFYPHPGWCEQNPQDWLDAVSVTVRSVLKQSEIQPSRIAAFGVVGVTHNAVLLDSKGNLLRPCIIIYDTRSQAECKEIGNRWGEEILKQTYNTISPVWTWPQLLWVKRNEPQVWKATQKVLFQKDYVRNCLAPSMASDIIDAEGSLLFDPVANTWIKDFVLDLGLPLTALPHTVMPTEIIGQIDKHGAEITGLLEGTPVIAGTSDTAAEIFGAGALRPGQGMVKLASVGRIALVTAEPWSRSNLFNYRHVLEGLWYPGTACKNAASAYKWLRETMWGTMTYPEMNAAAADVPPGCEGLIFHPHLQGSWAPSWDNNRRGNFLGVTIHHKRPHFTRAVMEGVAFNLRGGIESLKELGLHFDEIRLVGQGATSILWSQIMADTLQCSILIPVERDAAYGAAIIVGMGINLFPMEGEAINTLIEIEEIREPDTSSAALYNRLFAIYNEADILLKPISHRLTSLRQTQADETSGGFRR